MAAVGPRSSRPLPRRREPSIGGRLLQSDRVSGAEDTQEPRTLFLTKGIVEALQAHRDRQELLVGEEPSSSTTRNAGGGQPTPSD